MPRPTIAATVVALVAACLVAFPAVAAERAIDLRISYRPNESATPKVLTLRCDPARGTVAKPAAACRKLRALGPGAFAPTPRDRVCTQIAGGPMTALVTGRYEGRAVWARLKLSDGCAIARWNRVAFLFPR